jgi:cobalt-zinc-cadmium efflux system membrane fusion protein
MSRGGANPGAILSRALIHGLLAIACLQAARCGRAAEEGHGEPAQAETTREIRLSDAAVRAGGIRSVPVQREAFHPHVLASGVIRPVVPKSAQVKARAGGRVVRLHVDVGDRVRQGQTLATLEGSEVTAALARHRTADARRIAAREGLKRAERLLEISAISGAVVDLRRAEHQSAAAEAEAARQDLVRLGLAPDAAMEQFGDTSEFQVLAPISGTVLKRGLSPGLLVEREASLFEIADLSTVWAVADVYEKDLGRVEAEGGVEVRTDAYPGVTFSGRIELIEPALDEESRTAHVRVALDNRSGQLRPGMFVTVAVPLKGAAEVRAPAVPAEAVQKLSGIPAVFVEKEPGRYELRPVETGLEAHGMVEIRHGLEEGELAVVQGAFVLKSEVLKRTIGGDEH